MREDIVEMTKRELERWQLIQRVMLGVLTQAEAGEVLGLCERQVRRLVKEGKKKGARGLIHGSRGKSSPRKMAEELEDRITAIIRARYPDFSPLHATEKLAERHRIEVSREKVRQVMMSHGLWKRRRVRKEAHVWRERKHHVGELVQMDGSHHAWLEERGPRLVLMGYVDDATGRFYGRFYDHEGVYPAMASLRGYIERSGLPLVICLDKHSTYGNGKLNSYGYGKQFSHSRGKQKSHGYGKQKSHRQGKWNSHGLRTPARLGRTLQLTRMAYLRLIRDLNPSLYLPVAQVIRLQPTPTSPIRYLFMSRMPVFGAGNPAEPCTMAFPYLHPPTPRGNPNLVWIPPDAFRFSFRFRLSTINPK